MKLALTLTMNDGEEKQYTVEHSDLLDFEERFDVPATILGDEDKRRLSHMMFLAYCVAKRVGDTSLAFRDWVNTVDSWGGDEDTDTEGSPPL